MKIPVVMVIRSVVEFRQHQGSKVKVVFVLDSIVWMQFIKHLYTCALFHRGQSLQQLLPFGQKSSLLLVGQVLGVPGVQRAVGDPRRAQGPHGARQEGANDRGRRPDGNGGVVSRVWGF